MKKLLVLFTLVPVALTAENTAPTTVRIGYPTALHGQVAKTIDRKGIAAKHGLNAEFQFFQYGPPQIEGLVSKSLDVAFTSVVPTATLLAKQPGGVEVIASLGSSVHGLVARKESGIAGVADLRGHSVGVALGTDSYIDLLVALKAAGLSPESDVKIQNLPPNEQAPAFEQGLVDAVVTRPPQLGKLQNELGGRLIQEWPHHLWVIARSDFLKENPGVRENLVAAIREGAGYVGDHLDETAAWFAEDLRAKPEGVVAVAKTNPLYKTKPIDVGVTPELKAFTEKRSAELVEFGVTKEPVKFLPE